jgi:hypothetical protein
MAAALLPCAMSSIVVARSPLKGERSSIAAFVARKKQQQMARIAQTGRPGALKAQAAAAQTGSAVFQVTGHVGMLGLLVSLPRSRRQLAACCLTRTRNPA